MSSSPYFPHNPNLKQSKLRQIFESAPAGCINMGLGQPGEDTPDFIREAAGKVAREAKLGYTLNAGLLSLREKLASEFDQIEIHPDQICLTAGVQEALYALFYVLLDEKADVLFPDPGFLTYPALARLNHCEPRYYNLSPENNFRFEAEACIAAIRPETTAILLGHPSNPSGSIADDAEFEKLIHFCANRKEGPIWIIADEVYHGMTYKPSASMSRFLDSYPWIILLRGASKSHHMTGWRLGWAILPEVIRKQYVASHQYICTCASALTQHTFLEVRGSAEEQDWLVYQNSLYKKKRDLIEAKLSGKRRLFGGEGAFYWLFELTSNDLGNGDDEAWVKQLMLNHNVITLPGSAFGKQTDGLVRLSYGTKIDELANGMDILVGALT